MENGKEGIFLKSLRNIGCVIGILYMLDTLLTCLRNASTQPCSSNLFSAEMFGPSNRYLATICFAQGLACILSLVFLIIAIKKDYQRYKLKQEAESIEKDFSESKVGVVKDLRKEVKFLADDILACFTFAFILLFFAFM